MKSDEKTETKKMIWYHCVSLSSEQLKMNEGKDENDDKCRWKMIWYHCVSLSSE